MEPTNMTNCERTVRNNGVSYDVDDETKTMYHANETSSVVPTNGNGESSLGLSEAKKNNKNNIVAKMVDSAFKKAPKVRKAEGYMQEDKRPTGSKLEQYDDDDDGNNDDSSNNEDDLVPPDGDWGWAVALGCFIITSLMPLTSLGFGVMFSRYLLETGSSSTITAWIYNILCFMWNVSGLFMRPLISEVGWRAVGIPAVVVCSVGVVISAFTPSPELLFFSISLLGGAGGGMAMNMCYTILPQYFLKRRGMSSAIMMAGVCGGQIWGPPTIRFLQDIYGFRGATLILAAIILNGVVGMALFHPVQWHMKKREASDEAVDSPYVARWTATPDTPSDGNLGEDINYNSKHQETQEMRKLILQAQMRRRENTFRRMSEVSFASSLELNVAVEPDMVIGGYGNVSDDEDENDRGFMLRIIHATLSDLRSLRSSRALIIAVSAAVFINAYHNFIMYVPFAMQAQGHTLADSAWCISVSAGCNFFTRVFMALLSDCSWFSMKGVFMLGIGATSLATLIFPLVDEVTAAMTVMAMWGFGVGSSMGIYNLVIVSIMGLENLSSVFGAACLCTAIGFIVVGPVVGIVRDASGSYAVSIWLMASLTFISFFLWFLMPAATAYDQRREAAEKEHEEDNS